METSLAERRSPFYSSIVGLGATMGRVGGDFISAKYYSGIADEHLNTRKNVGVQDLSTMGKMDIKGRTPRRWSTMSSSLTQRR